MGKDGKARKYMNQVRNGKRKKYHILKDRVDGEEVGKPAYNNLLQLCPMDLFLRNGSTKTNCRKEDELKLEVTSGQSILMKSHTAMLCCN